MERKEFSIPFKVRDYECDMQGIVGHAQYLNYLMHVRHEFLLENNVNFAELAKEGINLIAIRVEIDYKFPLRSGNKFYVTLKAERMSKLKFVFHQNIYFKGTDKLSISAKVFCSCMNDKGRPVMPKELSDQLDGLCRINIHG